jgi:hypothetical protein
VEEDNQGSQSDYDSEEANEVVEEAQQGMEQIESMCIQYMELIGDNKITQGGCISSIKIHKQMYQNLHPHSLIPDMFPKTVYMLEKIADQDSGDLKKFSGILLDVCGPTDHYVYEGPRELSKKRKNVVHVADDEEKEVVIESECPICSEPRSTERQLLLMDIVGRIQTMWKHGPTRKLFM